MDVLTRAVNAVTELNNEWLYVDDHVLGVIVELADQMLGPWVTHILTTDHPSEYWRIFTLYQHGRPVYDADIEPA